MDAVLRDVVGLSSGTFATLTGEQNYDRIEAIRAKFIAYVETNPQFTDWAKAWTEFRGGDQPGTLNMRYGYD